MDYKVSRTVSWPLVSDSLRFGLRIMSVHCILIILGIGLHTVPGHTHVTRTLVIEDQTLSYLDTLFCSNLYKDCM